MTARDEMAVLFERRIIGEEPGTTRYDSALRQAGSELDDLASLATNPETAPAVFAWLVEAGVLWEMVEWCRICRDLEELLTPAQYLVWGKLFPPESLGPRCAAHLDPSITLSRLDQYAVLDLRPLYRMKA